jgi:hypothetical protein
MEAPGSPYASSPESAPKRAPRSPPQQQPPSEEGGNCHAPPSPFSVPSRERGAGRFALPGVCMYVAHELVCLDP